MSSYCIIRHLTAPGYIFRHITLIFLLTLVFVVSMVTLLLQCVTFCIYILQRIVQKLLYVIWCGRLLQCKNLVANFFKWTIHDITKFPTNSNINTGLSSCNIYYILWDMRRSFQTLNNIFHIPYHRLSTSHAYYHLTRI